MQIQADWRRTLLRSEDTAQKYEAAQQTSTVIGCRLCNDSETIQAFTHWRLVPNAFPYDKYFSKSIMLVSKRHTNETGLTQSEVLEFRDIKKSKLMEEYDIIFENLPKQKSIPNHLHYHIVKIKRAS